MQSQIVNHTILVYEKTLVIEFFYNVLYVWETVSELYDICFSCHLRYEKILYHRFRLLPSASEFQRK